MNRSSIQSWGPAGWTYLHATSFVYPESPSEEDKWRYYEFLQHFANVIPCKLCRRHFKDMLRSNLTERHQSDPFRSRDRLSRFLVDLHNQVNERLGKRQVKYETVLHWYTQKDSSALSMSMLQVGIACCVISLGYYAWSNRRELLRRN